jgi:acyl-[acyl carrier protein]--UDP-N-acetylglucosamine O-acyltransferase
MYRRSSRQPANRWPMQVSIPSASNAAAFSTEEILEIQDLYRIIYQSGRNISQAVDRIRSGFTLNDRVQALLTFVELSDRGLIRK